ncbi:hypothetical protein K5P26_00525 [Sphingopyxis sp. XHP0097]|uniref:Uncharacterized protein n=1 Tax=Sphingopyxis jiangsuensis TaxID=2871171 RepID=A0ABS7M9F1_9SPHN|nr:MULTISPECIES: hypothetical protein [Sphingopyxis]MBY4635619.1 hypothetical protein [Sphingopyxis jiangsuensis]
MARRLAAARIDGKHQMGLTMRTNRVQNGVTLNALVGRMATISASLVRFGDKEERTGCG